MVRSPSQGEEHLELPHVDTSSRQLVPQGFLEVVRGAPKAYCQGLDPRVERRVLTEPEVDDAIDAVPFARLLGRGPVSARMVSSAHIAKGSAEFPHVCERCASWR